MYLLISWIYIHFNSIVDPSQISECKQLRNTFRLFDQTLVKTWFAIAGGKNAPNSTKMSFSFLRTDVSFHFSLVNRNHSRQTHLWTVEPRRFWLRVLFFQAYAQDSTRVKREEAEKKAIEMTQLSLTIAKTTMVESTMAQHDSVQQTEHGDKSEKKNWLLLLSWVALSWFLSEKPIVTKKRSRLRAQ